MPLSKRSPAVRRTNEVLSNCCSWIPTNNISPGRNPKADRCRGWKWRAVAYVTSVRRADIGSFQGDASRILPPPKVFCRFFSPCQGGEIWGREIWEGALYRLVPCGPRRIAWNKKTAWETTGRNPQEGLQEPGIARTRTDRSRQ